MNASAACLAAVNSVTLGGAALKPASDGSAAT